MTDWHPDQLPKQLQPVVAAVIAVLEEGTTNRGDFEADVVARSGVTTKAIDDVVRGLCRFGLIHRTVTGRRISRYELTTLGRRWLDQEWNQ